MKRLVAVAVLVAFAVWFGTAQADTVSVTADGQSSPVTMYVNESVALVASASGCDTDRNAEWRNTGWNFGDGQTETSNPNNDSPCSLASADRSTTHTFSAVGTYTVTYSYQSCTRQCWRDSRWTTQSGSVEIQVQVKPPTPVIGNGTGLSGAYFASPTPGGTPAVTRIDSTVNFDWAGGSPDPAVPVDQFSVIWSGSVQAEYTDDYTFYTNSDDGIRLSIDLNQDGTFEANEVLIDDYTDHAETEDTSNPVALTAGEKYLVQIEYYENGGNAVAQFGWESTWTNKAIVPQSQLYPPGVPSVYTLCGDLDHVYLDYAQPLNAATATNLANYKINNGISVTDAALAGNTVTLTVSGLAGGQDYKLTVLSPAATANFSVLGGMRNPGLIGTYYDQNGTANGFTNGGGNGGQPTDPMTIFTGQTVTRTDPVIDFNWGNGSPDPAIPDDDFSARWKGQVLTRGAGQYVFTTTSDDGMRLYVNGQLVIGDGWILQAPTPHSSVAVTLAANTYYDITLEYFEHTGGAVAQLSWSGPGFGMEIIPQDNLSNCTPTPTFTKLQILVPGETAAPGTASGKTGAPFNQLAGSAFQVTVNAVGPDWNLMTDATDTIHLTTDDGTAVVQGDTALVNGTATFTVVFNQWPGPFTITATDVTNNAKTPDTSPPIAVDEPAVGGFGVFDNCTTTDCNNNLWPLSPQKVPITTKIAGQSFTLEVAAWQTYYQYVAVEPYYGGGITVELLDASDNSGALDQDGCRSSWTPIAVPGLPVSATILANWQTSDNSGGRVAVTFPAIPDAYRDVRVRVTDNGDNGRGCSTDAFAIRPAYFAVTASDQNRTTAGTTRTLDVPTATGTPFHNAGRPFTLTGEPRNAADVKTANYTIGAVTTTVIDSALGANEGTLTTGWETANGDAVSDAATYTEAGAFDLQLTDPEFAAVDAIDGTPPCQRTIGLKCVNGGSQYWTSKTSVGRFVPDHFAVALNSPSFATGCAAGQFTYVGKAFKFATRPVITVTARNFQDDTTTNYTGSLFKLKNDANSVSGRTYTDTGAPADATLEIGGLPSSADPVIADLGNGTATLTFSTGAGLDYKHAKPVAPFSSLIDLAVSVKDVDGVTVETINGAPGANPVTFNSIAFDNGNQMRYGRVFMNSAVGSELLDLPVEMVAQYYAGSDGFVMNSDDTCTLITGGAAGIALDSYFAYLPAPPNSFTTGDTSVKTFTQLNDPSRPAGLEPGDFGLSLAAPGDNHAGTVDITADVPMWLRFDWNGVDENSDGNLYDDDPSSRAAFGIYKGRPHRVYQREVVGP